MSSILKELVAWCSDGYWQWSLLMQNICTYINDHLALIKGCLWTTQACLPHEIAKQIYKSQGQVLCVYFCKLHALHSLRLLCSRASLGIVYVAIRTGPQSPTSTSSHPLASSSLPPTSRSYTPLPWSTFPHSCYIIIYVSCRCKICSLLGP